MGDIHAERRQPAPPNGPLELASAGADLLEEAKRMASGRAARTLTPGAHAPLKQTLVALRGGVELGEHEVNGPATVLLLQGSATLRFGQDSVELSAGEWSIIRNARHSLQAGEDTVALVTVVPLANPSDQPG